MTQANLFTVTKDGIKYEIQTEPKIHFGPNIRFNGADYSPKHDCVRLTKQILKVFNLMKDGEWRTLSDIAFNLDEPETSISAQLRNLRKDRFGAHEVNKRIRGERKDGLYEYRLIVKK